MNCPSYYSCRQATDQLKIYSNYSGGHLFHFAPFSTDEDTFFLENDKLKDKEFISLNNTKRNNRVKTKQFDEEIPRLKELCAHMEISLQTLRKIPIIL